MAKKRVSRKRRFRRANRYDDDEQIEISDEENSGENFDAYEYYDSESTLKTVLHLFVHAYSSLKKSEYNKELYEKVKGKFYELAQKLLQMSPDLPTSASKDKNIIGFNKCSLKGKSPIF